MKSAVISGHSNSPKTLTEMMEKASREMNYIKDLLPQPSKLPSPFSEKEDVITPSEFVTRFMQEKFAK